MTVEIEMPGIAAMAEVIAVLASWQDDDAPFQLHPGDLGWLWRLGPGAIDASIRVWRDERTIVAIGELDGGSLLRLAIAPDRQDDPALAARLAADLDDPGRGVLGAAEVFLEAPPGARVRQELAEVGWVPDTGWRPLRRRLADPVEAPGVRIELVGRRLAGARAAVQRSAFPGSRFTEQSWQILVGGPAYARARCLLALDGHDEPVAAVTVWSAGRGRPGLLEPLGVDREHRHQGFGRAMTAAAALRELGCSSATVCTQSSNLAAIATYRAAGFTPLPERFDLRRGRLPGPD